MKNLKYRLSLLLTFVSILALFAGIMSLIYGSMFWTYMFDNEKLNQAITQADIPALILKTRIVGGVLILVGAGSIGPIAKFRQKSRTARKFDEYGRSKDMGSYDELSVKEQKELDKQRMIEMNRVLPQTLVKQMTKKGVKNPEEEMNNLVGLQEVKDKMEEMAARMEFEKKHKKERIDTANHMVFFGPPGTGKTTVARIMTGFLNKYGYIKENQLIETSGSFFTSGDAATKADTLCQYAYGKVLFIDEAYAMVNSPQGQEAIATIIKQMEDAKGYFVLILAGYEDEMKDLLQSNPGFLSRIKEYFFFKNYNTEELTQIFRGMAKSEGFEVTREALSKVYGIFTEIESDRNFGNARTARNILDSTIGKHVVNVKRKQAQGDFIIDENDITYKEIQLAK